MTPVKLSIFIACLIAAAIMILTGSIYRVSAARLPVYTDPGAPARLCLELQNLERDARFNQWYERLATYETKHKTWADAGSGWLAAGGGLLISTLILAGYGKNQWMRQKRFLFFCWIMLWLLRIPLTFRYYTIRQKRFDYPSWGDSIAIPMFSESLTWVVLAALSAIGLRILLRRHPLPERLAFHKPVSRWGWARTAMIGLWIMLNALCVASGIPDGDEGTAFTCMVASALLAILLFSKEEQSNEESGINPERDAGIASSS